MRRFTVAAALLAFLATGCQGDPKTPAYWEKALAKQKRPQERVKVLGQLRDAGVLNPTFLPFLHSQLQTEPSGEARQETVRLLAALKDPSSLQPLLQAIDWSPSDVGVRGMNKEIAAALPLYGSAQAVPSLLRLLSSTDMYTQAAAVRALASLRAKEAVEPLMAIATDETAEPFLSRKALEALGEIGDPRAIPALIRMMFKERRGNSFYAESSFALFQLGKPAAEALLPVVAGQDRALASWARENDVREPALYAKAAQVLGDVGEPRARTALLGRLSFDEGPLAFKLLVRMKAAEALGRLRAKEAIRPLTTMLSEEEPNARHAYTRALVGIGGRDALPALLRAATQGSWDAREVSAWAAAMLGDGRELEPLDALASAEKTRLERECRESPEREGCASVDAVVQTRTGVLMAHRQALEAAQSCSADAQCWTGKLDHPAAEVRARAAYELGRTGDPKHLPALLARLKEQNLETRTALIQAAHWLVQTEGDGSVTMLGSFRSALPELERQLADERGRTQFMKVNEDLRRLAVALRNQAG